MPLKSLWVRYRPLLLILVGAALIIFQWYEKNHPHVKPQDPTPTSTIANLEARVADLETQNAKLKSYLVQVTGAVKADQHLLKELPTHIAATAATKGDSTASATMTAWFTTIQKQLEKQIQDLNQKTKSNESQLIQFKNEANARFAAVEKYDPSPILQQLDQFKSTAQKEHSSFASNATTMQNNLRTLERELQSLKEVLPALNSHTQTNRDSIQQIENTLATIKHQLTLFPTPEEKVIDLSND